MELNSNLPNFHPIECLTLHPSPTLCVHCLGKRLASGGAFRWQTPASGSNTRESQRRWFSVWHRESDDDSLRWCVVAALQFGLAQSRGWERRGGGRAGSAAASPAHRTGLSQFATAGPTPSRAGVSLYLWTHSHSSMWVTVLLSALSLLSRRVLIRPERLAPHALLAHFPLPCTCFFGVARRHRRAFRGMNHPLVINPLGCVSLIRFPNVVRSWGRGSIFELNLCGCTNLGITKKPQPRIAKTRNFLLRKRI